MKVAYLRVSSAEQREKQTIETQRAEVEKYCNAQQLKFDKIYEDDGVSGTIPLDRRPTGSDLMRDVEAGLIGEIYTVKMDRLGRNLRDFLNLRHRLKRLGVTTRFILQSIPDGPTGEAMLQMLGSFAELDRTNLLDNMLRGMKRKAATGWTGGPVNFGYRKEGVKREAKLVRHDTNADIILHLFNAAASGQSCQDLADYMIAHGIPTSRQNPGSVWRATNMWRIIRNPIYMGTRRWGRRRVVHVEDETGNQTKRLELSPENVIESECEAIVLAPSFGKRPTLK